MPARAATPWGPGRPYTVQAMPAPTFQCYNCGQSGHFSQIACTAGHQTAMVELNPQGLTAGGADISPEGAPAANTEEETRARW